MNDIIPPVEDFWYVNLLIEGEIVFSKTVAPGKAPTFQWKIMPPGIVGQQKFILKVVLKWRHKTVCVGKDMNNLWILYKADVISWFLFWNLTRSQISSH